MSLEASRGVPSTLVMKKLFHSDVNENDTQSSVFLTSLEELNTEADKNNIPVVKIQDHTNFKILNILECSKNLAA